MSSSDPSLPSAVSDSFAPDNSFTQCITGPISPLLETLKVKKIFEQANSANFFKSDVEFNLNALKAIITKYFDKWLSNVVVSDIQFHMDFDCFKGATVTLQPKKELPIAPVEGVSEHQAFVAQMKLQAFFELSDVDLYDMVRLHVLEHMPEVQILSVTPQSVANSKILWHVLSVRLERVVVQIATHR